jgi:hypothetical protein
MDRLDELDELDGLDKWTGFSRTTLITGDAGYRTGWAGHLDVEK